MKKLTSALARSQFGVGVDDLHRVVLGAVDGWLLVDEFDPSGAGGQFAYIFGTRQLRTRLCGSRTQHWEKFRDENIEFVRRSSDGTRIVFQNVDVAADERRFPLAISGKKEGSRRVVDCSQAELDLTGGSSGSRRQGLGYPLWYFCVSVNGEDVRAELSRPLPFEGNNFTGFSTRLVVVGDGEWPTIRERLHTGGRASASKRGETADKHHEKPQFGKKKR